MELVAHWRLSKQALIDLVFFCCVPIVLAMLSAVLGPYAAIMGSAGAAVYVLTLAIVPWWLTGLATQWGRTRVVAQRQSTGLLACHVWAVGRPVYGVGHGEAGR